MAGTETVTVSPDSCAQRIFSYHGQGTPPALTTLDYIEYDLCRFGTWLLDVPEEIFNAFSSAWNWLWQRAQNLGSSIGEEADELWHDVQHFGQQLDQAIGNAWSNISSQMEILVVCVAIGFGVYVATKIDD